MSTFRRLARPVFAACAVLVLAAVLSGCASTSQGSALQQAQYAWSAAIRWGDFEGAMTLVDPEYLEANPVTDLELARYAQVQISGYTVLAERAGDAMAQREIEIGVINRHTMAERTVHYREVWRWDPEAKAWWLTTPLPDLWDGQ
jgi:hypothetical protein